MTLREYTIRGSLPAKRREKYRECKSYEVVAYTALHAIELCLQKAPLLDITSLQQNGAVVVDDIKGEGP